MATLCRVLGISTSGFWAWLDREPSQRACQDAVLLERIVSIHTASRGTYGAPRIHAQLHHEGWRCSRKRVARLMRQAELEGCHRRRFKVTTRARKGAELAPDLVNRVFRADAPNRLWLSDITYVPTDEGSSTWPPCSMPSAVAWWAGRWPAHRTGAQGAGAVETRTRDPLWVWFQQPPQPYGRRMRVFFVSRAEFSPPRR